MRETRRSTVVVKILPSSVQQEGVRNILQMTDISPRSRLYGLVPCGVGTIWGESLTSYLNRLGWRHGVSPRALIAQEVVPQLSSEYVPAMPSTFCRTGAMSINGTSNIALEWSTILEQLTMRSDIHYLTSRRWIGELPLRGLFHAHPTWCSVCYEEWREKGLPIYQPLFWMFRFVTRCMKHAKQLENRCPQPDCQKKQSFIALRTDPGHCTQCNAWLGIGPGEVTNQEVDDETGEWQNWVTQALEELFVASLFAENLSWQRFFINLAQCIKEMKAFSTLARLAGIDRVLLYDWFDGVHSPSLESIFKLCYVCDVTPYQVMENRLAPLQQTIQSGKLRREPWSNRPRPILSQEERQRCLELICAVLDGREEPIGIYQIALRLGHAESTLKTHFPQECTLLKKQFREYRKQRETQRFAQFCDEVQQAVIMLHAQGVFPSQSKVRKMLSHPNWMRMPEANNAWHAAKRELGLEL